MWVKYRSVSMKSIVKRIKIKTIVSKKITVSETALKTVDTDVTCTVVQLLYVHNLTRLMH